MPPDAIVIGGGLNGLVAAAYLARSGAKPLVLEKADQIGGCLQTSELLPGFKCPLLSHAAAIDPGIVRDLELESRGLQFVRPDADLFTISADGRPLVLWADPARAAQEIRAFSTADADRYPEFLASFARIADVLHDVNESIPPDIDSTTAADVIGFLKTGWRFRSLGRIDAYRLLRWMPMAVADLVAESFESEPLRAAIAAGGILGSFLGPWSAGTGAVLLLLGTAARHPIAGGSIPRGGMGALVDAVAASARAAGAEIRTGAAVAEIIVDEGRATGVRLASGETIRAATIVSALDVKLTLLGLVDPANLSPGLMQRVRNIRAHGTLAKVNFAVSALPRFGALAERSATEQQAALSGRIRFAADIDTIERAFDAAKYGGFSDNPWIELTIPSVLDPSLAPAGQHVVSAYVQYMPYDLRGTTWPEQRDRLVDVTMAAIERQAPGFSRTLLAREVITPADLEGEFGLAGGHIFHGELALDQWYLARPLLGWTQYDTPIRNLYLCGAGTHPGIGGMSGRLAARVVGNR